MGALDIGIDLGTATIQVYISGKGIVISEPSVVAVNSRTMQVLAVGDEAYKMLGRTPDKIRAVRPLADGVISDFHTTEQMVKYFIRKACGNRMIKPRVSICVPSEITEVERAAVVEAAVAAGARKVYSIEEPVAAALGAGIDISKPCGNMVLDIGGGTTDIAVLTLNGIATSTSLKIAGNTFDAVLVRQIRQKYNVLIGEKTAEKIKIGMHESYKTNMPIEVKGRHLVTGLPQKLEISWEELYTALVETLNTIVDALIEVLDRTPPELVGDVHENGIVLTGGGSKVFGLAELINSRTGIRTWYPPEPDQCVVLGAGKSFEYLNDLHDGFVRESTHKH